jgi:hypothetical protein
VKGRAQQAAAASEYLSEHYNDGTTLQLKVRSMLDDLAFDPAQERVEAAGLQCVTSVYTSGSRRLDRRRRRPRDLTAAGV